ncbi:MAG: proprotein convertase P-domain-containing protein, partial [Bacteroidota bacterium]
MEKRNITLWGMLLLACMTVSQSFAQVNVNMPFNTGVNQTFTIAPPGTCAFNFYDNGGPAANYSVNSNNATAVTFAPAVATNKIQAVFSAFATESGWDALYVFDGGSTASPLISSGLGATISGFPAGGWQGTTAPNNVVAGTVRATAGNATGRLTFTFGSDASVVSAGWAASVTEAPGVACAITAGPAVSASTGAGAVACSVASITLNSPTFAPAGCNATYSLQYRINGGAAVVIGSVVPATTTLTNIPVGVHVITWELVNPCGGAIVSTATQALTVTDNTAPTIACPSNITINLGPGECKAAYSYTVGVTDNCPFLGPLTNSAVQGSSGTFNNNFAGVTFDIRNDGTKPIKITGINANLGNNPGPNFTGSVNVSLYRTIGNTAIGFLTNPAGWTQLTNSVPTAVNVTTYFETTFVGLPAAAQFTLAPGQSTGIYVVATNGNFMRYSNGSQTTTDGTLTIISNNHGAGAANFGNTNVPRLFKGSVQYQSVTDGAAVQTSGIASGSEFPIGTTTNCFKATDAAGNTATCCFNVTVQEYPNAITSLICNDLVYFSIDEDCNAVIGADQILEGGPYGCYDNYIVELDRTAPFGNGPWTPGVVGLADVGKTYQVRVTDPKTGNKCWGNIKIEDKLAPKLTCCDVTLPCNANTAPTFSASNQVGKGSGNVPVAILDNQTVQSSFNFSACNGATIQDVNVKLNITHTWIGDLRVTLVSPKGTTCVLWANNCSTADNIIATFDDEAPTCSNACADYSLGLTLRPLGCLGAAAGTTDLLSKFDGENPAGTWKLTVNDNATGDQGTINGFDVQIAYLTGPGGAVPSPEVTENCQLVNLTYLDSEVNGGCAQGFYKKVLRKWTGTDEYGNTGTCLQTINLSIPTLNDLTTPPDYDGIDAPFFLCT